MPGRDHDQAVGLVEVAGDLGDQLRGADADRAGEAAGHLVDALLELAAQGADRGDRVVGQVGGLEVDERLVERQRLDERADLAQQRHHRAAGVAVGVEPAGRGRPRWDSAAGPRRWASRSGRRRCAPRRTRSPRRRARRRRRRRPACRAARACRAAPRRRRRRRDPRAGSSTRSARRDRVTQHRPIPARGATGSRPQAALRDGCPPAVEPVAAAGRPRLRGWRHDLHDRHRARPPSSPAAPPTSSPSCRWCSASIRATRSCCSPSAPPGAAFHARVDLPLAVAEQEEVADLLVGAVGGQPGRARRRAALHRRRRGRPLPGRRCCSAGCWSAASRSSTCSGSTTGAGTRSRRTGHPARRTTSSGHPFTAQGVFDGQVVHRDRAELADTLVGTDEEDAVEVALAATRFADLRRVARAETGMLRTEARWLQRFIRSHLDRRRSRRSTPAGCWCSPRSSRPVTWPGPRSPASLVRRATSSCGVGWCAGLRETCCRARARCWPSPPGSTATAPWRGARSTAASRSTPTTRWPTASRRS